MDNVDGFPWLEETCHLLLAYSKNYFFEGIDNFKFIDRSHNFEEYYRQFYEGKKTGNNLALFSDYIVCEYNDNDSIAATTKKLKPCIYRTWILILLVLF